MANLAAIDFYFVVVNYHSTPLIRLLISSIEALELPEASQIDYQILAVNNSPEDTAIHQLATMVKQLSVIEAQANLGFGHGCNLALQQIYQINPKALVWLINPDTLLCPNALAYVNAALAEEPDIAILGTGITDTQGEAWFSRGTFNPWLGYIGHRDSDRRAGHRDESMKLSMPSRWVSGCSLIVNLANFADCPLFDTRFFLYYEDNDLCERVFRAGLKVRVTRESLVIHDVSAIVRQDWSNKYKNTTFGRLLFLQTHGKITGFLVNIALIIGLIVVFGPFKPSVSQGRVQGLWMFLSKGLLSRG
ncbi:MAG: glycosyltransferase [Cyanobacteria bacterium P01_G01_bin.38]